MLSGDIGAGKSTILLALEFALFGFLSGVSGATLLRHGSSEGSVQLKFMLQGEEYEIKRTIKKTSTSYAQSAGYLGQGEIRKEGTATELTAWIVDLLGYPKDLATKNKSLLFRFTVYTPQEAMKHILFESPEKRLDILRKVFGIDKYKHIKENDV